MKYNKKPAYIPLGPPTSKPSNPNSPKKAKDTLHDQGIFSQRQLRISYDKLYDAYELDALAKGKEKQRKIPSIPFSLQYQKVELEDETATLSVSDVCHLCLGKIPQSSKSEDIGQLNSKVSQNSQRRSIVNSGSNR
jgi:hypothetical protein